MQKHRFLRLAVLILAVLTVLSFAAFAEETDSAEDTTLTFGIFSDIHDVTSYMTNVMNNFETLAGGNENIDGIAMVGDIAYLDTNETPTAATYNIVKNNADLAYFMEADKLVYAMGNHEFPLNANSDPLTSLSRQVFTEQIGYAPESHHVLGGYHFITGGPNSYDGKMTAAQEQYVMDEITEALKDGEEKPIFVFVHHPIDETLYNSGSTRHSEEFVAFLKSQPRVIVFDGHMHYPESDPRSIYQVKGGATFVYTSSVHGGNTLSNPYATQRHDKSHPSQAYLMEIDTETNVVTLNRFYVSSAGPEYLEEGAWTIDIPAMIAESKKAVEDIDTAVYKYTYAQREADSVAPVYGADAEITVTELTTKEVTFTYPEATPGADGEDNLVGYYKVELYDKATDTTTTKKFISDYFLKMSARRKTFTCSFDGLDYESEYTLRVTPVNMWYVEGEPITLEIKTDGPPAGFTTISGYDESYYATPVTLNAAGNGWNIDTTAAFKLTAENNKRLAGIYAVSKDSFATKDIVFVYGTKENRQNLHVKSDNKFVLNGSGSDGKFAPGKFSANTWIGAPGNSNFYSDTQWYSRYVTGYLSATDDPEGTEGGKTAAEKKLAIMEEMIASVKSQNVYVGYALVGTEITPISEVSTLSFGFSLNAVYSDVTMTITNSVYRLVAYVMDENGNVTTHGTNGSPVTLKTGTASYATFNFKTAEWDTPLPEEGYFVGYRVYPYYGLSSSDDVTLAAVGSEIDSKERVRFVAYPSTYTVDIPKASAPTGIKVDGTTFSGLDKNTTYSIAPYTVKGADNTNSVDVNGVTSYTLPDGAVGPYGIYIKGDGVEINNSDAFIAYVRGAYTARIDLHDRLDATAGTNYAGTYKVVSTVTPGSFSYTIADWKGHATFSGGNGISTTGDHISSSQYKTFYTAFTATYETEDEANAAKKAAFDKMISSSKLTSKYLQYNMASDEIIPISEMNKYSYKVSKQRGGFTYNDQVSEFSVLIMDSNGVVTEYTYQHVAKNLSATTVTKTVDFKNKTSSYGTWIDELPSEGYVVGFRYKIYANLDDYTKVKAASGDGTRYMIVPTTSYTIDIPKTDAPKGVTVDGTFFKGLDANKTYTIAPYNVLGIDTTLEQTVTGVTEFDVAENFENAKGTYIIYIKGDGENYMDSDPSNVCYIQGTVAQKKNIVFTDDGLYNVYAVRWAKIDSWSIGNLSAPMSSSFTAYEPFTRASNILTTWFFPESKDTATNKANLPKVRYAYAYNPDEIPTVKELNNIVFKVTGQNSSLVAGVKAKVNFVVLNTDGRVTNHSVLTNQYTFKNNASSSFTVNFKSITDLPEEGYVLGFEIYPFGEIITMTPENTAFANLGLYFYFTSTSVSASKAKAPTGITVEGTTFKGLDAEKNYIVSPYTVVGATEGETKTVTGVTSVDVAALYENPVGLYGIAYDVSDYNDASDPGAIVYVAGSYSARKDLGNLKELTYTWNSGANSVKYTAAEFEKVKESDKEWSLGKLAGAEYFIYNGTDYNSYKCDWMYSTPSSKALYEAEQANDGSLETLQKQAKATIESISFRYAYAPDEIIPVGDVTAMKFTAALGTTYITVTEGSSKYVLYVMNTDGTVSQHIYLSPARTLNTDISANTKNAESIVLAECFADLPEEGWIIGYKFYPYGDIELQNITYTKANIAKTDTQYAFYVRTPLVCFDNTYTIVAPEVEFGMSLLLDGKIGVKMTALESDTASGFTLSNVVGTENYVDFGSNDYAIFYLAPKDVASATVSFDVTFVSSKGSKTESFTLSVAKYIDALKLSDDEKVAKLGNAFDTFFKAADDCLSGITSEALADLTAEELADLESKATYNKTGTVAGIEFHSSSLVLEEDTAIRHYFVITDDSIETDDDLAQRYSVAGGTALKLADRKDNSGLRYAYTDVADISSNELSAVKTVTVTDALDATVTINFNALAYVDLCLDKDDVKLLNLAKALYRYSVESEAYMAD